MVRFWVAWAVSAALAGAMPALKVFAGEPSAASGSSAALAARAWAILQSKCLACHGDDARSLKGGLDLRTRDSALRGGVSGEAALVPGRPDQSRLYRSVTRTDPDLVMPPKENDKLSAEEVKLLERWIAEGGRWPNAGELWSGPAEGVRVRTSGGLTADWTQRAYDPADLWAYRPLTRPTPPGPGHPIDAFVNARLAEANLAPAPLADRRTLIRRLTFDLTGLPPTPQEIDHFLQDPSPDAYSRLVERLLASPRYGERWAQHWLDVVRYADTSGFANDFERPNAWRYRDYVIRSFNADKPFDRFILEQIAGDEFEPGNPELAIAVGFLRMGPWEHTSMSVAAVTRQQFLDDVTNAIGEVFLGHSLRCCKCHDHKFDPLPTRDYYRLMAVFAPVQFEERAVPFLPGEVSPGFDADAARLRRSIEQASAQLEALAQTHYQAGLAWLKAKGVDTSGLVAPKGAINPYSNVFAQLPEDLRPPRHLGLTNDEIGLIKVLTKRREHLSRSLSRYAPEALTVYNGPPNGYMSTGARNVKKPRPTSPGEVEVIHILAGGALESPLEPVTPGVLSAIPITTEPRREVTIPTTLSGRRLALAQWIASPENPLTARVIVNRLWQHHFGQGIVATPNNFGKMGRKPSHPELLDYLAQYLIEHGWRLKDLHRLIVTSETYRRSARHPARELLTQKDPNNVLLAAFPVRRLSAEEIRDAMLQASGELDLTMGGPGVFPLINMEAALQPRHVMGSVAPAYQPSPTPQQRNRRTIYAFKVRGLPDPMLEVFNRPGTELSCAVRDTTTVAPQAFALFNSQSSADRALALAARLQKLADQPPLQIALAFRLLYGREARPAEVDRCLAHLSRMKPIQEKHPPKPVKWPTVVKRSMVEEMTGESFSWDEPLDVFAEGYVDDLKPWEVGADTRALADLCLVLMNSNEFLYVE